MRDMLRVVFGLNIVFVTLLAISFPALEPGTGSYVIAVLSLCIIALMLLLTGGLLFIGWSGFRTDKTTN
jgi:hypothetical protein